ncbi:protein yellow-like [Schistocerca gregaria]|uniref:protein yellow-like n=1 Tax=Schistocerca gregaria TaxID=7010 RepID=UPI00211E7933|nr:protein yellow-like [Schistocerca gregaria]
MAPSPVVVLLCVVLVGAATAADADAGGSGAMREEFAWKESAFAWPDEASQQRAVDAGSYVVGNNLPLGLARWRDKMFVTVPRWRHGVAATLNYFNLTEAREQGIKAPVLHPYPDWESNLLPEGRTDDGKQRVVSVFRVSVDACDRLWVMDTGVDDILGNTSHVTPPKLMVFDLKTDKLLREFRFKQELYKDSSFFANVVADVEPDQCDKAYAYLPDLGSYALIVYSWEADESWRVTHHYFHFDPLHGNHRVEDVNFQWTDGVFGVALSRPDAQGERTVFFHALSSLREFSVPASVLRNRTAALATGPDSYYHYRDLGFKGNDTQATASYLDVDTGVLFFTQLNRNGVACWNTQKPLEPANVHLLVSDGERFSFPNDLKVDAEGTLWVLTDRLPVYVYKGGLDPNTVNYRIFSAAVKDLIKGTVCEA